MRSALHQHIELPIPPYFKWNASEWAALRAASNRDPAESWTFQVIGRSFIMRRDSQPIFEGRIRPTPLGAMRLIALGCEGDEAIFRRGAYACEGDVTDLFIAAASQLIERQTDSRDI